MCNYFSLLLLFCFISGCDKTGTFVGSQGDDQEMVVKKWAKLDSELFDNQNPLFILKPVLSMNKKWLYLPTGGASGKIAVLDIGDDFNKQVFEKRSWSRLSFKNSDLNDSKGKAVFSDTGTLITLNAAVDGLLLSWHDVTAGPRHGALYVKGKSLELAWQSVLFGDNFRVTINEIDNFFAIKNGDNYSPYLLAHFVEGAIDKGILFTKPKFEGGDYRSMFKLGDAKGLAQSKFAQTDRTAFLVSRAGISTFDVSGAGTKTDFSKVDFATPVYGSDEWNLGDPLTHNYLINDVLVNDNKLYIGLGVAHDHQGGVAIFDIASGKINPPKKSIWNRVDVKSLSVDPNGKVWAVVSSTEGATVGAHGMVLAPGKEIVEITPEGEIGERLNAQTVASNQAVLSGKNPTTGYVGTMPDGKLRSAIFIDDAILLTTDNEAHVMLMTKEKVNAKK